MKASLQPNQCTVPEITTILQDSTNSMRNLHQLLLQEDGIEVQRLFRLWEKLQLRASKYKNHRIFTLRCIHSDLVPSSIKLKSTLKSTRANQILRKAEKDLLQARVKSINYVLEQTSKQLEECRSKLVTIVSTQKLRECQDFVDKVGEIRFNKVKLRQLNKLNLLTIRKEGNITRFNNTNSNNLASCNLNNSLNNSQANINNSQVNPPREGSTPSQASTPLGKELLLPRLILPLLGKLLHLQQQHFLLEKLAHLWQQSPLLEKPALLRHPLSPLLPGKESLLPRLLPTQATTHPYSLRSTQSGQASNNTRPPRQSNRHPPTIGPPRLPRR